MQQAGQLILIMGPSGSGKGTIIKYIKENYPKFVFPTSCTTRQPRPGEQNGDVYHFISKEEFKKRINAGDFLEWAIVHADNYYGTLKSEIIEPLQAGKTVLREVDYQGVEAIQKLIPPEQLTTIFITTESWEDLKQRILSRADTPEEELAQRKASYEKEIAYRDKCDYVIINKQGELATTQKKLNEIIKQIS